MHDLHFNLSWLEATPPQWRERLKATKDKASVGSEFRQLAQYRLTTTQLSFLGSAIVEAQRRGACLAPLRTMRLGLAASGTIDMLVLPLIASAARHGIALECVTAPYGQAFQQAADPASVLRTANCDMILLALLAHEVPGMADGLAGADDVASGLNFISQIAQGFRQSGANVIVQNFVGPQSWQFGSFDRTLPGTRRRRLDALNSALPEVLAGSGDHIFDVASLAERIGLDRWISRRDWNMAKLPFAAECIPAYAEHVARLLAASRGLARRCLVLDLDNTLWGGVLGDDGIDALVLGEGSPVGEAHLALQRYALELHHRGIMLAVSSKNEDDLARRAVDRHPEMLLRTAHFAAFQANWSDKAANIRAIAADVSLGLSSLVFLDDNPVERALVRTLLPEVAVPELPEDPSYYVDVLDAAGYFEAITFSAEDAGRTEFFRQNKERQALLEASGGLDAYLSSLGMYATFAPFDDANLDRICQLINKSNQFNLTTLRYTAKQLKELMTDRRFATLQIRLKDCFGDNGMISVVILERVSAQCIEIVSWLMSCRVLGRRLEEAVLCELVRMARDSGCSRLLGRYCPTERNGIVRDHYAKLGFSLEETGENDSTLWSLDTASDPARPPIEVVVTPQGGTLALQ